MPANHSHGQGRSIWTSTPILLLLTTTTLLHTLLNPSSTPSTPLLILLPYLPRLLRTPLSNPTARQDLLTTLLLLNLHSYSTTSQLPLLSPSHLQPALAQTYHRLQHLETRLDITQSQTGFYIFSLTLLLACAVCAGAIVGRGRQLEREDGERQLQTPEAGALGTVHEASFESSGPLVLPSLLLPARTTHQRLFPRKHGFGYSYLYVGVPVGLSGKVGPALSVDSVEGGGGKGWFEVRGADYLHRGPGGLEAKLDRFLRSQGREKGLAEWEGAYLVTAPRFAGYAFNPVSFWYLYGREGGLGAMVLEVNNTFGERRMYFLAKSEGGNEEEGEEGEEEDGKVIFKEEWGKDFHVSPFNSRKGSYSLRALDPLGELRRTGRVNIDNTIVLRSSKEHAKIVARVFSDGEPRDATNISNWQLARFVAAWWWVGLVTFPRIVWQAKTLFLTRKLHVWYRPEVATTSLGREYSEEEFALEEFFWKLLREGVYATEKPLRVIYRAAHFAREEMVLESRHDWDKIGRQQHSPLELGVTSPAFYSRFVHYAHAKEAFDRECLFTDEKNRTLQIASPTLLPLLLQGMRSQRRPIDDDSGLGLCDSLRWSLLRRLRCPPAMQSYGDSLQQTSRRESGYSVSDIRPLPFSEIDGAARDSGKYRKLVTQLFAAERIGGGFPAVVALYDWVLRFLLILVAVWYCERARRQGVEVWRVETWTADRAGRAVLQLLVASAVHFWALVKGSDG